MCCYRFCFVGQYATVAKVHTLFTQVEVQILVCTKYCLKGSLSINVKSSCLRICTGLSVQPGQPDLILVSRVETLDE